MPLSPKPTLKLGLDPSSPHWLTDITREVGEVDFSVGTGGRRVLRRRRSDEDESESEPEEHLLRDARLRLRNVRAEWVLLALRREAMEGGEVYVELFPDGDQPGAMRILGTCRVTSASLHAGAGSSRRRWMFGGEEDDGWRDDEFELTFTADVRCETIHPW